MEVLDIAVIGAGWYGLAMAKAYLEVNPDHKIMILDANKSIGGVWAKERLYAGLTSNNLLGTYEYSDFLMNNPPYNVTPMRPIPGDVLYRYLNDFVQHFGLDQHIQLQTRISNVRERDDGLWQLSVQKSSQSGSISSSVLAHRIVVATGMTSQPNIPHFKGHDSFDRPIFHSVEFSKCREFSSVHPTGRVAVLGSAKSAYDAAYLYASEGIHVDWIIRRSGAGPGWMAPPFVTPLKIWLERIAFTRFTTWFSPCVWGTAGGYSIIHALLHSTFLGRLLVSLFWRLITNDLLTLNDYSSHPATTKLKPWSDLFWSGSMLSILNYPTNIFDFVRKGIITVHIADIDFLSTGAIHLDNGTVLDNIDLFCCATGWRHTPSIHFEDQKGRDMAQLLGLPHHSSYFSSSPKSSSSPSPTSLDLERADATILTRFPSLKSQPQIVREADPVLPSSSSDIVGSEEERVNVGYNLFRFAIPPSHFAKRNIAFVGALTQISTAMVSQTQALWVTAYFAGKLAGWQDGAQNPESAAGEGFNNESRGGKGLDQLGSENEERKSEREMRWETVLHNRFSRWRYPTGFGARFPDFVFDTLTYVDLLLQDLGLNRWRKGSAFAEVFQAYTPADYRGLVKEWMKRSAREKEETVKHVSM